jgi:hypothetical protein
MFMTTFVRVLEAPVEDKPTKLLHGIRQASGLVGFPDHIDRIVFEVDPEAFSLIPGNPFAYWVNDKVRSVFTESPPLNRDHLAMRGAYTTDDARFYRLAWEVADVGKARSRQETLTGQPYVALAKGGSFSRFYADIHLVIRWAQDGAEAKAFLSAYRMRKGWGTDWSACLNGYSYYFRPGLTWPLRTQSGLGLRVLPEGCIFTDKGPAAFIDGDSPSDLLMLLAVTTSSPFRYLVELQMAFGSYEVGVIQRTPVPVVGDSDRCILSDLARRAWSLKQRLDSNDETSHAFLLPPRLNEKVTDFNRQAIEDELCRIENEIDDLVFAVYGIDPDDQTTIEASVKKYTATISPQDDEDDDAAVDNGESAGADSLNAAPADAILAWLVGVVFGRFDERLATGERPIPAESEPFDPLPSRSPGMWPEDEPRFIQPPDVMVDDLGHDDDIRTRVTNAASEIGLPDPEDLRQWLAREFFPLHVKMYSKSRRKAPIYWQLATPSASYSVWLYIHAFSSDTLFRVQNDYVGPKLGHEERRLEVMMHELSEEATAAERRTLAAQEAFVEELRAFLDEVKRVAPLWRPNLDDGVVINFAPLWRLVPQHKLWQKEVRSIWDALCDGKYDWAHLAMHLWPERVVPKCASDRSLAITHGLEEVFWMQEADGKWTRREIPTRSVIELVLERTSHAVKAALTSLLEAPATNGGSRARGGRRRAARADVRGNL